MEDIILNALLKKAKGYEYDEKQDEYAVREDGEIVLVKRKIVKKYSHPDSSALKTYVELCADKDIESYSDEELIREKGRLLAELLQESSETEVGKSFNNSGQEDTDINQSPSECDGQY